MNKTLILVVEDDRPIRNLIVTTLKTHDYKYLAAENGSSAILEASSHNPDIVLLDLGLPDMEGVEVIKKIRTWSNMPIIVISARSEDTDKIEALDAGADDYITKPFSVEELLARIRVTQRRLAVMQSGEQIESSVFENGGLKIDYTAGCTYLKGEELHLTPIEYKLLCLLSKAYAKSGKAGKYDTNGVKVYVPSGDDDDKPDITPAPTFTEEQFAAEIFRLTNVERTKYGKPLVQTNDDLNRAAMQRAKEISVKFSHTRPDGTDSTSILSEYGIPDDNGGENIAAL